jgi:hypothetical protein
MVGQSLCEVVESNAPSYKPHDIVLAGVLILQKSRDLVYLNILSD